jgi:hypothetical protein
MSSTILESVSELAPQVVEAPTLAAKSSAESIPQLQLSSTLLLSGERTELPVELLSDSASAARQGWGFRSLISRFFKHEFWDKARKLAPWFISGTILGIDLIIHAPIAVLGAGLAALSVQVIKSIIRSNPFCQKLWKALLAKAGMEEKDVPWVKISAIGFGSWIAAAAPSLAFLETAEQLVTGLFTQTGGQGGADVTTLIPLLFGVIRVIFIIYVLVAIVRVVNAFRNDEDWATAARIPMIVVLCVVLGRVLKPKAKRGSLQ